MNSFLSRKFLLSSAAFLAAFCTGVAGVFPPEYCAVGMALSAGIYAASEAYVDGQSLKSNQTIKTTNVEAKSTDRETVAAVIAPKDGD